MFFWNKLTFLLIYCAVICQAGFSSELLGNNPHFLVLNGDKTAWIHQAINYRQEITKEIGQNLSSEYLNWMSANFTCRICMMFDSEFIKPGTDEYLIDSLLADGKKEFGGYDSIVLWHAYPRLGIDERNQFDMYRQMPGGLEKLRQIVEKCHRQNVKVFIDYNPWDIGTRREEKDDFKCLAEIVSAINADGVFLDTLSAADPNLRKELDNIRPGLTIVSEGHLEFPQLALCSGSWAQWLDEPEEPGILKLKWVQPRHMQYQIRRWDIDRSSEIETAFFNGSGMLVWENVFGTYNPWNITDRQNWKKVNLILHYFQDEFSQEFEPYYLSMQKDLYITHWSTEGRHIFVMLNRGNPVNNQHLFDFKYQPNWLYYDLWSGEEIKPQVVGNTSQIICSIDKIGCIAIVHKVRLNDELQKLLDELKACDKKIKRRNFRKETANADKVKRTKIIGRDEKPEGMVFVDEAEFKMKIEHVRGECGCYPDIDKNGFGYGLEFGAVYPYVIHQQVRHLPEVVKVSPYFIDETEVTNAQYQKFLQSTGYKPKYTDNFLKHWPNGQMPEELADYPVVYINIDDARAYARWAGKRLPTEAEWQLAAQGIDGRKWPWGNEFSPNNCNTTGMLQRADSYPDGKSIYGCYNMSGNVWEWTESCRDDGHTRYTMIRGGSYFKAEGSIWYVNGGPQPCDSHVKFVKIWPGIDRCSTVGFRCVIDAK